MSTPNTFDDFWAKVDKSDEDDCWLWTGVKDKNGYGFFWYQNKLWKAPRFLVGVILEVDIAGLMVCHHCDNPTCVNSKHLFVGTAKDNAEDRELKGRGVTGRKQSEEHVRKRMESKALTQKPMTQEMKDRIANALRGRKASEETKAKLSAMRKGVPLPKLSITVTGEGNGNAMLTDDLVRDMRKKFSEGRSKASLAREFGIGETQVGRIVRKEAWDHVE